MTLSPERIAEIKARLKAIDGAPWKYDQRGQEIIGKSRGGCNKELCEYRVADIRGWGHLQYMGETRGDGKAQALQDGNGEFIAHAPQDIADLLELADALCTPPPAEGVTEEMVDNACEAFWKYGGGLWIKGMQKEQHISPAVRQNWLAMKSALEASSVAAESAAWRDKFHILYGAIHAALTKHGIPTMNGNDIIEWDERLERALVSKPIAGVGDVPPVERMEMVTGIFSEPAEPQWRVQVSGICADFPTETWANNFRNAILALIEAKPIAGVDRDTLGRKVREAWIKWALAQPTPKPSWLVPYDDLSEPDKEADRQIGETIFALQPTPIAAPDEAELREILADVCKGSEYEAPLRGNGKLFFWQELALAAMSRVRPTSTERDAVIDDLEKWIAAHESDAAAYRSEHGLDWEAHWSRHITAAATLRAAVRRISNLSQSPPPRMVEDTEMRAQLTELLKVDPEKLFGPWAYHRVLAFGRALQVRMK